MSLFDVTDAIIKQTAGTQQPDGSPTGSDVFAGSSYGSDQNVGGTDVAGFIKDADPRDFMFGRDPNYVHNTVNVERGQAHDLSADIYAQGQNAQTAGATAGQQITNYSQNAASAAQSRADNLSNQATTVFNQALGTAARTAPQANYSLAGGYQTEAGNNAYQLGGLQPSNAYTGQLAGLDPSSVNSAAQAQLQSGLNQAEASNLALARSGHGWGASASAMNQAISQNAAAGQQATNASAQLRAQEGQFAQQQTAQNLSSAAQLQNAQNAQRASNLAQAGGLQSQLGQQYGAQALSQAQLQSQTMGQNDQAQAALYGASLGAQNNALQGFNTASGIGAQGTLAGAQTMQAGQTLGMQGTQNAMGIFTSGEQLAGQNMQSQQAGDLAREGGLIQNRGIDAGLAVNNANTTNAMWGAGLSTAGTIGAASAMAASDSSLKSNVKPLDSSTPPLAQQSAQKPGGSDYIAPAAGLAGSIAGSAIAPGAGGVIGGLAGNALGTAAGQATKPPPPNATAVQKVSPYAGAIGGGVGAALGTVIAPGAGTVAGGIAGSVLGNIAGKVLGSDTSIKTNVAPIDPSGSTQAGVSNAYQEGRGAAAQQGASAAKAIDDKAAANDAAAQSMLMSGIGNLHSFGNYPGSQNAGSSMIGQYGHAPQPMYGSAQPWGSNLQMSDVHSKQHIETLRAENKALRSQIQYPDAAPAPTQDMLNQAAADQAAATPGQNLNYPEFAPAPSRSMLNQAAQAQIERSDATDAVEAAPGYSYDYIEPDKYGYGRKFGPMAQDLASTPAGASTVVPMPNGKLGVDTGRLALVNTAALHTHQQELKKLRSDIDAMKGGAVAENGAEGGSSGSEPSNYTEPASSHHFWEVPDYSHSGKYVPFWQLPSSPYAPAQELRERGKHLFGKG